MIRPATPEDSMQGLKLLLDIRYETNPGENIDRVRAKQNIDDVIREGIAFVWDKDGEILGSIGAAEAYPFFWSAEPALCVEWFAITKKHRSYSMASALIACVDGVAAELHLDVVFGNNCGFKNKGFETLMQRKGYRSVGATYVKG